MRPRLNDRPMKKNLSLRTSLIAEVDLSLNDPLTGKPQLGLWSDLVMLLLIEWLENRVDIPIKPTPKVKLDDFIN